MIVVIIILMSHLTQPEWIVSCVNGEELGRGAGEGEDVDGCSAHNNNLVTPQSKDGEKRRYGTVRNDGTGTYGAGYKAVFSHSHVLRVDPGSKILNIPLLVEHDPNLGSETILLFY